MNTFLKALPVILFAILLASCSGGGGSASTANSNWDQMKWDQDKWK